MNFKEMLEKISILSEETKETAKGRVHKAEPGGYGRKHDTDEEGDEKKTDKPEVKRGRGRPKKGSDESGEVKKYEFGGVEKAMGGGKVPKNKPKPSAKHTLKDWFEMMDKKIVKEAADTQPVAVVGKEGNAAAKGQAGFISAKDPNTAKAISTLMKSGQAQVVVPSLAQPAQTGTTQPAAGATGQPPAGQMAVKEKWGTETKVSPEEKGKYSGKSKSELLKAYNALKKSGPHKKDSKEFGRMRELAFAIRAKSGWGKVQEAERPSDQVDMGAGLGAGRSQTTLEAKSKPDFLDLDKDGNKKEPMKKAAKDMKKDKVNESMHKHNAAKLLGKAHALAKEGYNPKFEDIEEARMYHEGYKEGLDECYGMMPIQGKVVDETSAPATPPATTGGMASAAMPAMEAVSQDSLFDAIQPVIDFAMSKGYTVKKGRGHSIDFMYDLGMGPDEVVMSARVNFDKDFNEPWVTFDGMGVSGTDPAKHFLGTFKQNHKAVMDEVGAEKEFRNEVGDDYKLSEGMPTDGLFDSIQPVLNFAMSKGYTVKKGKGNSINFMYDLGMGDEPVMNAQVYFDKDLNEPWVNFEGMDMSGNDPAKQFLGTFKQNHAAVMDEVGAEKQYRKEVGDEAFGEGNAFTAALAKTPQGGKFTVGGKTFTDKSNYDAKLDEFAFESLDKQLNQLLTEGEQVDEGMSVSISKGQQGSPDSVTVSAQDAEAEQLLGFIKQAGLGLFADKEKDAGFAAPEGEPSVDHGGIKVVDDHDGMMGLMKKLSDLEGGQEHQDHQGHGEAGPEMCSECGMQMEEGHQCSKEPVEEVETADQRLEQVAENNPPDSGAAETTADEEAEAQEDQALSKAAQQDKTLTVNEWANDAGQTSEEFQEETFTTDMEFMLDTISSGLNKKKSTGQQTIPVLAGDKARTNIEENNSWYKKYSDIIKQAE